MYFVRFHPGQRPSGDRLGRGSRRAQALGTAVVFGMLFATLVGVFLFRCST